jgi:hypothetical protein
MSSIDISAALSWLGALFISVGGISALMLALTKWFGDRLANKLLEKDKAKYAAELEGLKLKYLVEIEVKKAELEKSKSQFIRYSEHQFKLYNDLWISLYDLNKIGHELWEQAAPKILTDFSAQLVVTKTTIEKSALLIEENHYKEILTIIDKFGQFGFGKLKLIEMRNMKDSELSDYGVDRSKIFHVINQNGELKDEFSRMIDQMGTTFRKQIKGE